MISNYLAIGVGSEVQVAKRVTERKCISQMSALQSVNEDVLDTYATFIILPRPLTPVGSGQDGHIVRLRSMQFLPGGRKMIVSYLNHGVVSVRSVIWKSYGV